MQLLLVILARPCRNVPYGVLLYKKEKEEQQQQRQPGNTLLILVVGYKMRRER